ncbi:hypothetical protein DEM26_18205 [Thioclava sp. NG1]|uniref:hypothetical protein n=1 Tax=Thioclava sp. NG1 TaxID=2182426 RepID=UPI000D60C0CA|nr:hypothetical protein [Thioclava sp. NG1]PWE48481.1 hypothetical protein DEM26_18205 [Thioclava sp. NG1]
MRRRQLLAAAPALGLASLMTGGAVATETLSREEKIRQHAEALLDLIREEFAEDDHNSLSVTLRSNWGPVDHMRHPLSVEANAGRTYWKEDERGGYFDQESFGPLQAYRAA